MKNNLLKSLYFKLYTKKWSIIFFIFVVSIGNSYCQQKSVQKKRPTTVTKKNKPIKKTTAYSTTSFNLNLVKVPVDYKGIDPILLYNKLEVVAKKQVKSEFETSSQYNERINIENENPIIHKLNKDSILAFCIKVDYDFKTNYDAENQLLSIKKELKNYTNYNEYLSFDYKRKSVQIKSVQIKAGNYIGSNGFGASQDIRETESNEYHLLIDNWRSFDTSGTEYVTNIGTKFNLNTTIAKQIVESIQTNNVVIGCLFIGKLSYPFSCIGYSHSKPTIDYPFDFTTNIKYINLHVLEIWFYNKLTGEIYAKLNSNNDNSPAGASL